MDRPGPITFTYGYADYQALNRLMRRDSIWKRTQFIRVPLGVALGVTAVVIFLALNDGVSVPKTLANMLTQWLLWALIAVSVPFVWILNQIELKIYYRRQRFDGALICVSVDDEAGITSQGHTGTATQPWSAIRKIVSDAEAHVILYDNRIIGMCLPRRAFGTQKAFDDFAAYAAAHIAAA